MSVRLKLFLLFAACAAPFVLGWAAWYFGWSPGGRGNYGELLAPHPVDSAALQSLRGKWIMVSFDGGACDAYCEKKLYFMRQVRLAQGKDQERVARLWIVTDSAKPRPELLAAIEGSVISRAIPEGFPGERTGHIYLVDPLGNLMMRFPRDPDPSKMLKDLQRLLKYSQFG